MVTIDIEMPTDCASCWIRLNIGCRIANESGWLNNRRDEQCPLKELVQCKDCKHRPKLLVTDIEDMESGFDLQFPDYKCPCRNDDDDWYSWYPSDDWFCANGERRMNDA